MKALKRIFNIASIALAMTIITSSCTEGLLGNNDDPNIGTDKKIFECCGTVMGNRAYGYFVYPDKHTSPFIKTIYMAPGTDMEPLMNQGYIDNHRVHMIYRCEPGGLEPIYSYSSTMEYAAHDVELISAEGIFSSPLYFLSENDHENNITMPATRLIDLWGNNGCLTFITKIEPEERNWASVRAICYYDEENSTDDTLVLLALIIGVVDDSQNKTQSFSSVSLKAVADRYKDKNDVKVQIYGQDGLLNTLRLRGSDFISPLD